MKISELIEKLQEQKAENGDMELSLLNFSEEAPTRQTWMPTVHFVEPLLDEGSNQVKLVIY